MIWKDDGIRVRGIDRKDGEENIGKLGRKHQKEGRASKKRGGEM